MNIIKVNYDDEQSIKEAEKLQERLINKGLSLKKTEQKGFNVFVLTYEYKRYFQR